MKKKKNIQEICETFPLVLHKHSFQIYCVLGLSMWKKLDVVSWCMFFNRLYTQMAPSV